MSRYNINLCSSCVALLRESGYNVEEMEDFKRGTCAMCGIVRMAPLYVVSKEVKHGKAT